MTIEYYENAGQYLLSINFIIPIGMQHYNERDAAFAHLIEHLIFHGNPLLSQYELMQRIEELGGIMNARTEAFYTVLFLRIREAGAVEAVKLICDAITCFDITSENVRNELAILEIEEKQEGESPADFAFRQTQQSRKHNSRTKCFTYKRIKEIYENYYKFDKWKLLIVGQVSANVRLQMEQGVKAIASKYMGSGISPLLYEKCYEVKNSMSLTKTLKDEKYFFYFHECRKDATKIDIKIIKYLFASGLSAIFYDDIVAQNGYSYTIYFADCLMNGNYILFYFPYENITREALKEKFLRVFQNPLYIMELPDVLIERAVNMTITEYYLKAESVSSKVNDIIEATMRELPVLSYERILCKLEKEKPDEIKRRLSRILYR